MKVDVANVTAPQCFGDRRDQLSGYRAASAPPKGRGAVPTKLRVPDRSRIRRRREACTLQRNKSSGHQSHSRSRSQLWSSTAFVWAELQLCESPL